MDPIQDYVTALLKQTKLDTLPDEMKVDIQEQLTVQAYRRIGVVMVTELGQEKSDALMTMVADPAQVNTDAVNRFITEHTKGFETKVQAALVELGAEFIKQMKLTAWAQTQPYSRPWQQRRLSALSSFLTIRCASLGN